MSKYTDELNEELAAEQREDLSFVWQAVKLLPQNYREVIHLYHHEGLSTAQIAQVLGRNESTVRSDLRRGRLKLRELLKEAYDFE
ncbi:MAG: RNA polymerase sigma factor [Candidatus Spyradocola sp.]